MRLFLDDVRTAPDSGWAVVRSYDAFVKVIEENGTPEVISFDHDLGFEHYPFGEQNPTTKIPYDSYSEKTGYHCAKWCIETGHIPELAVVHSWNTVGSMNIANVLSKYCRVIVHPSKNMN